LLGINPGNERLELGIPVYKEQNNEKCRAKLSVIITLFCPRISPQRRY